MTKAKSRAVARPILRLAARGFGIFVMLATLMLVTLFMTRSRDPEFWSFMNWKNQGIAGGPPLTKNEISNRKVGYWNSVCRATANWTDASNVLVLGNENKPKSNTKTANGKTDSDDDICEAAAIQ